MRPDIAPKHCAQIETLVKRHFYDGVKFHRVIDGSWRRPAIRPGPARAIRSAEHSGGVLQGEVLARPRSGMARGQDNDSANCQFFICFAPARYLEEQYTVWGEVISGMEFIDKVHRGEPPKDPDKIVKLRLAGDES